MNNTTAIELKNNADSIEAIIFIIGVVFWYAIGTILLIYMQTITPAETVEDSDRHSKKLFTNNLHEKSNDKTILEELVDREKRVKLWDIYLGTTGELNHRATQAERLRIQHMQRKLAVMKDRIRAGSGSAQSANDIQSLHSNLSSSAPDLLSMSARLRDRRQLSKDQQILEEWQTAMCDFHVNKNWPWAIQKLFIQRHLRRQRH